MKKSNVVRSGEHGGHVIILGTHIHTYSHSEGHSLSHSRFHSHNRLYTY